jgi:hypothetical protein
MRDVGLGLSGWLVGLSVGDAVLLLLLGVGVLFGGVAVGELWRRVTR